MKTTQAQLAHRQEQHAKAIAYLARAHAIEAAHAAKRAAKRQQKPLSAFGRADDRAYGQLVADFRAALAA